MNSFLNSMRKLKYYLKEMFIVVINILDVKYENITLKD